MLFELCLSLGYPHPDYLLPHLDAGQLLDWQRYAAQYGLPARRNDIHHGMLCSLLYGLWRSPDSEPMEPWRFMPWQPPPPEDDSEDISPARIRSLLSRAGGLNTSDGNHLVTGSAAQGLD